MKKKDIKIEATAIIWGCTTGMMAICSPLISKSQSSIILPLAVILGASISTVAIWRNDKQESLESSNSFQQINQRISDLETICISEDQ